MENSIEEDIKILEELRIANENCIRNSKIKNSPFTAIWKKQNKAIDNILSNYKRVLKENEILKEEKEQAWEEWNNLEQGSYGTEQKLKQQIKELRKENEELKYKIKGQECVIETQVHNEEVYESIFEKLEKENKELKKQVKSDVNTIF
jgi:hypothetical protein